MAPLLETAVSFAEAAIKGVLPLLHGEVPLYNPLPVALTPVFNSAIYPIPGGSVRYVPLSVANHLVGPDNQGGSMSHTGLRRFYGPEPRFETAAVTANLSLEAWARRENTKIKREADKAGHIAARAKGLLNPDGTPKRSPEVR